MKPTNAIIKRRRRKAYLKRKKALLKARIKSGVSKKAKK